MAYIWFVIILIGLASCSQENANEQVVSVTESQDIVDNGADSEQKKSVSIPLLDESRTAVDTSKHNDDDTKIVYKIIEWTDLMPQDDIDALSNPPSYLDEIPDGSEFDIPTSSLKSSINDTNDRYQQALVSKRVRPEFNNAKVRIPGFIVPLEFSDEQIVTTFFLVPFFGACIHLPPPPPNQIIFSEFEPGMRLEELYDPFWIEGTLSTTLVENELATAAYSIDVASIKPYYDE